jgi:ParB-like chromosome segregation protein Spo0J
MINWSLSTHSIRTLKPHSKNPRQISKEQFRKLESLIEKFGFIDRPIINSDLTIICGHQRIKALKKKKVSSVECWVPDQLLDEKEVEELMVRHNLNTGGFDYDILANEYDMLDLLEYGFSEDQLMGCIDEDEEKGEKKAKKDNKTTCPMCSHEF